LPRPLRRKTKKSPSNYPAVPRCNWSGSKPANLSWAPPPEDEELEEDDLNANPTIEPVDPRPFDQIPDHSTVTGKGFWLGKFELTQSQWESAMGTKPWQNLPSAQTNPDKPAVFISWDDA